MDKYIDLPPQTKIQRSISRCSVVVGIALNVVAWTFYTKPLETRGEQAVVANPHPLQADVILSTRILNPVSSWCSPMWIG